MLVNLPAVFAMDATLTCPPPFIILCLFWKSQQLVAVEASLRDLQAALVSEPASDGKRDESPAPRSRKPIDMKAIVSTALAFRDQNRALAARMNRRDLSVCVDFFARCCTGTVCATAHACFHVS